MTITGSLPGEDGLIQILDKDGHVHDDATVPEGDDDEFRQIYEQMRFARHLDNRAISLHRQGRIGTYPPLAGQEAAQIASTHALAPDDWISYQYREHGTVVARDISHEYLLYWMGHEIGNEWLEDRFIFPLNISIGSQIPHATGLAWAAKLKGDDRAVICHFGDGATSEGDFHESLNFAGVFDVPAVFFCNNNQYAISINRDNQTASSTIAGKAHAYGFDGIRVDGMDPLAVYQVTRDAVTRAKDPHAKPADPAIGTAARPTLIEAVMYRLGAHTTVDDPDVYRETSEVNRWAEYDPIDRMETFLLTSGIIDEGWIDDVTDRVETQVASLIEHAEAFDPTPGRMFDHVYEKPTSRVQAQKDQLEALRDRHGDDELLREE